MAPAAVFSGGPAGAALPVGPGGDRADRERFVRKQAEGDSAVGEKERAGLMEASPGRMALRAVGSPARDDNAETSDESLMARIAEGDRRAARLLMERRLPRVLGLARRMLNDPHEAEDVAQDTFIRVWNAAARWEPGRAQVATWISRIAMNLCYDRLRKRREVLTDEPPERADGGPGPEQVHMSNEASVRLREVIASLPDRQRQAMELVHFQELSNIEAAQMMEVSVEAMESLLARARRKLKALLMAERETLISSYHDGAAGLEGN